MPGQDCMAGRVNEGPANRPGPSPLHTASSAVIWPALGQWPPDQPCAAVSAVTAPVLTPRASAPTRRTTVIGLSIGAPHIAPHRATLVSRAIWRASDRHPLPSLMEMIPITV